MNKNIPAVSIVIPMYNAEKYVGECLDSILAQTFDDYEVIVVDDCSTDNSAAIVESYIPKFKKGGEDRLQLIHSKVNSGGASTPRNIGLKFTLGDYVYFVDSDDAVMPDALEKLYAAAKKFNADIVHFDKNYKAPGETVTTDKKFLSEFTYLRTDDPLTEPTLFSENLIDRVQRLVNCQMRWEPWAHLIRRGLLIENELNFSNLSIADDFLFSIRLIFIAKKIVLMPGAFYVWRTRDDSNCREVLSPEKLIHRRTGDVFRAIGILDKFMDRFKEFASSQQNKYAVFEFFANYGGLSQTLNLYAQIPAYQLDELIRAELAQVDNLIPLTAFIFSRMNNFNLNILQQQQQIQQLQAQLQQLQPAQFQPHNEDIFK